MFAADLKTREAARAERKGFGYPESPTTRRRKRVSLKGQMLTTDDEMWKTGLQMAEETGESTLLEDGNEDQQTENEQEGSPDVWTSERYPTGRKEELTRKGSRTGGPMLTSYKLFFRNTFLRRCT